MDNVNLHTAEAVLRVFTGILFFTQGYDKLFRIGIRQEVHSFAGEAETFHVPKFLLWAIVSFTSLVEFAGGLMLILGVTRFWTLAILGIDLLLVSFAFSFTNPMWDTKHVLKRMCLVLILLLVPSGWAAFTLDKLLFK